MLITLPSPTKPRIAIEAYSTLVGIDDFVKWNAGVYVFAIYVMATIFFTEVFDDFDWNIIIFIAPNRFALLESLGWLRSFGVTSFVLFAVLLFVLFLNLAYCSQAIFQRQEFLQKCFRPRSVQFRQLDTFERMQFFRLRRRRGATTRCSDRQLQLFFLGRR